MNRDTVRRMFVPSLDEFRLAARRLRRAPLFTLFAVASLAVGVGVTTIAYAVVSGLFGVSSSVRNPEEAIAIAVPRPPGHAPARVTATDYVHLRRVQRSFSLLSAAHPLSVSIAGSERTVLVAAEAVDGAYFETTGAAMAVGRPIQPADEATRAAVVVLSAGAWREHFGANPAVVGRAIRIGGRLFDVIGVAAPGYTGFVSSAVRRTALWIPLESLGSEDRGAAISETGRLSVIGRLRPGVGIAAAASEVTAIGVGLDRSAPLPAEAESVPAPSRGWTARALPEVLPQSAGGRRLELVLVAIVMLVLVVACTNLASLVLARGTLRQQDVAVRRALGAGEWRLVREQLAESLIIAAGGAVAAVAVMRATAVAITRDLQIFPGFTLAVRPHLDGAALAFAALALGLSLVVFGLEPAIRLARTADVRGPLAAMAARMGRIGRFRVLLRWQVAASTAFFVVAVVTVRYVAAEIAHESGVRLDGLVVAEVAVPAAWDEARVRTAWARILEETRRPRGIESVALARELPFGSVAGQVRLSTADPRSGAGGSHRALQVAASSGLFTVLGIPIVRGRGLDDTDAAAGSAVISELGARMVFGTADAVGRLLFVSRPRGSGGDIRPVTIVGVAGDTDTGVYMRSEREPVIYSPLAPQGAGSITIVARAANEAVPALDELHAAIRRADADLAVVRSGGGWDVLAGPFTFVRFVGTASLALGAITLLLSMAGLYGIQSQSVSLRTREIGVRLSFGATRAHVYAMVMRESARPVIEGLVLGLVAGVTARAIGRLYLDVPLSVLDPWMLALVPAPLLLAAFCAGYLPARRASRVDPGMALRDL